MDKEYHLHDHMHFDTKTHTHEYTHSHDNINVDAAHSKALLVYMLEHNKHHAEELHMAAHSLEDQGKQEAANLIFSAVDDFEQGNKKLEEAIKLL